MRWPRLVVMLAQNALMGILFGWMILAAMLWLNIAGLGDLMLRPAVEWTGLLLIAGGFAVTFGSLAMGTAIFLLPRDGR